MRKVRKKRENGHWQVKQKMQRESEKEERMNLVSFLNAENNR